MSSKCKDKNDKVNGLCFETWIDTNHKVKCTVTPNSSSKHNVLSLNFRPSNISLSIKSKSGNQRVIFKSSALSWRKKSILYKTKPSGPYKDLISVPVRPNPNKLGKQETVITDLSYDDVYPGIPEKKIPSMYLHIDIES